MLREGLARWREWAAIIAAGGEIPDPIALLSVGGMLKIGNPPEAIEGDAAALVEIAAAEKAGASCRAEVARVLEPWGSREKLQAAVDAAEAEAKRLREIAARVDDGCGEPYWLHAAGGTRARHKRLFPDFESQILARFAEVPE
jgi:hypothetical protein